MQISKLFSFVAAAMLVAVVFAGLATTPVAAQTDTMQFHYNAQHTGDYSPVAGPVPSNGQLKWSYPVGNGRLNPAYSSPAVANGIVYVGSGNFSDSDSNLYALNATTGSKLWNYTTGGRILCTPAVANGVVYIGSNDSNFYAINAITGQKLWNHSMNYSTIYGAGSSPAVVNGVVYVGSSDNNLYALDAATGTKLWNYTTGGRVITSPAVANGVVYIGSEDKNVYALDAATGTKLWNYTTGNGVHSSPAVANGIVYVGSDDHHLYALYANNGTQLWNSTVGLYSTPAAANGVVYVGGGNDGNLYALYANNGTQLWNYTVGGPRVDSSPAVANGVVYVGSFDYNVYAINATTGAKLWNYTTGYWVPTNPAVVNGVVYVGSGDGIFYAIGTQSETVSTALTIAVSPSNVAINKPFTINGTLNTTAGTPIAGATIQLQKNVSGTWTDVSGKANITITTGAYRISTSEPVVGTYQYRTSYASNNTYSNATSNVVSVSVKVVSKASVLQDIATLRTTLNRLPNSAFIPGTKIALLASLNVAEVQVRLNRYTDATTTLQKVVLPRMDGCAKTGTPDYNDWVRTCAAQNQLYPQVQNLIQELQALQGS